MKPDCQAIITARKRRGWTQAELSEKAGIAARVVQDTENQKLVERGRRFHPTSLESIAGALGVPLETIVEQDPPLRPKAVAASWLLRALDRGRDQCEKDNQPYVTAHLLLTLLRIPQGAAEHCFGQLRSASAIADDLSSHLSQVFPRAEEVRFRDFDWQDRQDFNDALKLASAVGRATDKHLLYAILTGTSETISWLRARLGEIAYDELLDAVEKYPDDKPPGWSNAKTPNFSVPDSEAAD